MGLMNYYDKYVQELERMRTLMKEEEKRQREHDAAIEVLRRYLDFLILTQDKQKEIEKKNRRYSANQP